MTEVIGFISQILKSKSSSSDGRVGYLRSKGPGFNPRQDPMRRASITTCIDSCNLIINLCYKTCTQTSSVCPEKHPVHLGRRNAQYRYCCLALHVPDLFCPPPQSSRIFLYLFGYLKFGHLNQPHTDIEYLQLQVFAASLICRPLKN